MAIRPLPARPEIFVSTTSTDLRSCRQRIRDGLLTLGCVPVVQDNFPPDTHTVREMLREKIATCDAVVHLAGECYGAEPHQRAPGEPRRSYTQLEYDLARELQKPVYVFVCGEGFPYDPHPPEAEELRTLQQAHRSALMAGDALYLPIRDPQDLEVHVRELQTRVEKLGKELSKTRSWLGRGVAAGLIALGLIGGILYLQHQRARKTEERVAAVTDELSRYRDAVKAIANQYGKDLEPDRVFSDQEKLDRALAAVAAQMKVSVAELRTWSTLFVAQVRANPGADFYDRALADFAERKFADATQNATKAAEQYRAVREAADAEAASATARSHAAREKERLAWSLAGKSEFAAVHFRAAIASYQQALALVDEKAEPLAWCQAAASLEEALNAQGRYTDAESLARRVVNIRTALQGAENRDTVEALNYLGNLLRSKGQFADAQALLRKTLAIRERTLGEEALETVNTVNDLANILADTADFAGAEALYRRALAAREKSLGAEHPSTLASINNLAVLLQEKGDYAAAEPLHRRTLEARKRTLGAENLETTQSMVNLAIVLRSLGGSPEVEPLYRQALAAFDSLLGPEHPDTLATTNNLANLLSAKGDYAGAEVLYRRTLEARERTMGPEHPDTLVSINNLADLLNLKGDRAEAAALCARALEANQRTRGPNHPQTIRVAYNFSTLRAAQWNFTEAHRLAKLAVDGAQVSLPAGHRDRKVYENWLAALEGRATTP